MLSAKTNSGAEFIYVDFSFCKKKHIPVTVDVYNSVIKSLNAHMYK